MPHLDQRNPQTVINALSELAQQRGIHGVRAFSTLFSSVGAHARATTVSRLSSPGGSVAVATRAVGVSPGRFRRLLRAHAGQPFVDILRRLSASHRNLRNPRSPFVLVVAQGTAVSPSPGCSPPRSLSRGRRRARS